MISDELKSLLFNVVSSWQVIAITIAVILYISLVSFVAQMYQRPRLMSSFPLKRRKKKEKSGEPVPSAAESGIDNSNDELGLED